MGLFHYSPILFFGEFNPLRIEYFDSKRVIMHESDFFAIFERFTFVHLHM